MKILKSIRYYLLRNRSTKQTIIKNAFWLTISQVLSRFVRALLIVYAARVLGASEYGIFSYALGLAAFFTIFADTGVNFIMTREVAQKPNRASYYFVTSFWIKAVLLTLTALAVIFIAPYFSKVPGAKELVPFIAFLVIFDGLRDFSMAFFRAKEKMEWEAFINIITNFAIAIFGFLILKKLGTARALTVSYIVSTGAGAAVALFILRRELFKIFSYFDRKIIKPVMMSAWPVAVSSVFGILMTNVDIIMLGWWRTPAEIGFYSSAQKIVQVLYTFPAILANSTFPTISRFLSQKEEGRIKSLMERIMALAYAISMPIAVGGAILSAPLISFLYGGDYLPAAPVFSILILLYPLIFINTVITNILLAYDRQRNVLFLVLVGSTINVFFNALLIPKLGAVGAAFTTFLAQSVLITLFWRLVKNINNFYTFRYIKKIIGAALLMGIVTFLLNAWGVQVFMNIMISAVSYFFFLYLLKEKMIQEFIGLFKNQGEENN